MRLSRVTVTVLVTVLTLLTMPSVVHAGSPPGFDPPRRYYLALGDSLAYGFQASKVRAGLPPSAFDTGYVDVFATRLGTIRRGITVVNYGCPGESTDSFLTGPCAWRTSGQALHNDFHGAQVDAAVAFLRTHRGQVSPITITLFGNDMRLFLEACNGDVACVRDGAPAAIARLTANLAEGLRRLRAAAPGAEIIVMGAFHPYIGFESVATPLMVALNGAMARVAAAVRARFADPVPVFNPAGREAAALCGLTLVCTENDSHPSDAGYRALAGIVFDASGYERLPRCRLPEGRW